ncbi:MAG: Trm112 family protein [Gammaproteobacteria bacterium]|nr:Trm112 family protein [Gammaproteobacteria bacterium]
MNKKMLEMLVCPSCKGKLTQAKSKQELWCLNEKWAFRIQDGIPILLRDEVRLLSAEELSEGAK